MFSPGDEGGVKVEEKVLAEHSFYVSDDEKAIAIQDLLEDLKARDCGSSQIRIQPDSDPVRFGLVKKEPKLGNIIQIRRLHPDPYSIYGSGSSKGD